MEQEVEKYRLVMIFELDEAHSVIKGKGNKVRRQDKRTTWGNRHHKCGI